MRLIAKDLWLCVDCTIAAANGDYSGMEPDRAAEVRAAVERMESAGNKLAPDWDSETEDGQRAFSKAPCDCCGDWHGGSRDRWALIGPATYADLKADFRIDLRSDPWGHTLHHWFMVADEIYFRRPRLCVPADWQFRPSPLGPNSDDDGDPFSETLRAADDAAVLRFGNLLSRYADRLRHAGKSY